MNIFREKSFYIGIAIVIIILWLMTDPEYNKQNLENAKPTPVSTKEVKTKTSTPSISVNPCDAYVRTPYYSQCIKDHTPKLNATVRENAFNLLVINNDNSDWTGCDYSIGIDLSDTNFYEVGGGFGGPYATIPAHQTMEVPWGQFTKPNDGTRFNYFNQAPKDLTIDCTAGGNDAQWSNY